ncbi:FliA/WhiG family RNA polymerase sigma factor [Candidatus Marinamargulisbacteria bacterium SCGC AG-439-L15]|nr:FliA/WhiG family RNA polymerase sigma factor [Candidatus Marinamargulisbacteria bacterium SCGC AG-439-L15]
MALKAKKISKKKLAARNQLVVDHIYLIRYVVNVLNIKTPPGVTRDDLMSIGSWGLIDAANKFDMSRGVLFKTYAVTRIRGSILDELRRHSLGGQTLCRKAKTLEKTIRQIEQEKEGKPATDEEIAKALGFSKEKLLKLYTEVSRSFLISLDDIIRSSDNGETIVDTIEDTRSPEPSQVMEKSELKQTLLELVDALPEQEKRVLTLYYYEELTFREIGYVLEVSESRVSQIHTKAILRMRSRLKSEKFKINL